MKLLDGIKKYFQKPKPGNVYAVTGGDYHGEFLVYMRSSGDVMSFLSLPDMKSIDIQQKDVTSGIENMILDKVENLPDDVFTVCEAQYTESINPPGTAADGPSNDTSEA